MDVSTHVSMDVKVGDVLAGKYRVERVLGRGGMGVVVAALHLQLQQRVALKFLLPEGLQRPEMLARFSREARAAARIRSEHVARVVDVGTLDSGVPYIVMEYLEGGDLSEHLAKHGPLAVARAAELALEACEGLAEAHALGIVHRDLKPANLFLARSTDRTDCLKILDFGISKIVSPDEPEFNMTQTGAVVGSPYYMSPEQMQSARSVDARADLWSLGVILYELVSGRVPFDAPTLPQLCGMILTEAPPSLAQWRPDVPPRFQGLVSRCLEKDPGLRFQSVAELAVALAEFAPAGSARSVERILRLSGSPARPDERAQANEQAQANERATHTDWGRTFPRGTRSRGLWGALAAFALMAGLASWVFLRAPAPSSSGGAVAPASTALPVPSSHEPEVKPPSADPAAVSPSPVGAPSPVAAPSSSTSVVPTAKHAPLGPKHGPMAAPSPPESQPPPPPPSAKASPSPLDGRL